jgi:hypothetical protein
MARIWSVADIFTQNRVLTQKTRFMGLLSANTQSQRLLNQIICFRNEPLWIRIDFNAAQPFLSMRIRIQIQGFDDQNLEKNYS